MALSQTKREGNARHVEKLDILKIQPYREEGAIIRAAAASAGQSVQAYILQAVRERMARDNAGEGVASHIEVLPYMVQRLVSVGISKEDAIEMNKLSPSEFVKSLGKMSPAQLNIVLGSPTTGADS